MLTVMSDTADRPGFVTEVETGMGASTFGGAAESPARQLGREQARRLVERIEEIASARLRARAASRQTFVG